MSVQFFDFRLVRINFLTKKKERRAFVGGGGSQQQPKLIQKQRKARPFLLFVLGLPVIAACFWQQNGFFIL